MLVQGALGRLGRKKKMTAWGHAGPFPRIGYKILPAKFRAESAIFEASSLPKE